MRSFAVRLEPSPDRRLAAAVLLFHVLCAAGPWLMRVPEALAAALSVGALAGFLHTLSQLPGRHCRLAEARHDGRCWQVRLAGSSDWLSAEQGVASRAYPALVHIQFRAGRRRVGWLLRPGSVPAADFRRLKARVRLA